MACSNAARSPAGAAGIPRVLEVSGHVSNREKATLRAAGVQTYRDAAYLLGKIIASLYCLPIVPPPPDCLTQTLPEGGARHTPLLLPDLCTATAWLHQASGVTAAGNCRCVVTIWLKTIFRHLDATLPKAQVR